MAASLEPVTARVVPVTGSAAPVAARAAAGMASGAVTARAARYVDTVDVAGVVFRVSCRYPKPRFWARTHPELLTRRAPDVVVAVTYDEAFRRRARRPAGEATVADAARVRRRGRALVVTTGYYRAVVDPRRGRVAARVAAGFGVAGLMRTLAALWLLERDTVLLRAVRLDSGGGTLVCGVPADAVGAAPGAVAGYLAVSPRPAGVATRLTPFLDRDRPLPAWREAPARTLWVPGLAPGPPGPAGQARAAGVLLPAIWQADRRRAALVKTLELASRIVAALRCSTIGAGAPAREDAAVG